MRLSTCFFLSRWIRTVDTHLDTLQTRFFPRFPFFPAVRSKSILPSFYHPSHPDIETTPLIGQISLTIQCFCATGLNIRPIHPICQRIQPPSSLIEVVPIRRGEESLLKKLYDRVPVKLDTASADFEAPHFKTFRLLQARFSRVSLPPSGCRSDTRALESAESPVGLRRRYVFKCLVVRSWGYGPCADVCSRCLG